MGHIFETHINCEIYFCPICDGGLAACTVCRCAEGTLPTDCPGKPVSWQVEGEIHRKELDYRNGQWVKL